MGRRPRERTPRAARRRRPPHLLQGPAGARRGRVLAEAVAVARRSRTPRFPGARAGVRRRRWLVPDCGVHNTSNGGRRRLPTRPYRTEAVGASLRSRTLRFRDSTVASIRASNSARRRRALHLLCSGRARRPYRAEAVGVAAAVSTSLPGLGAGTARDRTASTSPARLHTSSGNRAPPRRPRSHRSRRRRRGRERRVFQASALASGKNYTLKNHSADFYSGLGTRHII